MKSRRVQKKSWVASLIGLGCLAAGAGIICLLPKKEASTLDPAQEQTTPVETQSWEEGNTDEKVARESLNPFAQTTFFERTSASSATELAMLEIKISNDGNYQIKECITGEICSKGTWQYNMSAKKITLTNIGGYPMQNVFLVEEYINTNRDADDVQLDSMETEQAWQLVFIANESTNLRYDLLGDGDIFIQKSMESADPIQLQYVPDNEKG